MDRNTKLSVILRRFRGGSGIRRAWNQRASLTEGHAEGALGKAGWEPLDIVVMTLSRMAIEASTEEEYARSREATENPESNC